jgi:hypothetical protein
LTFSSKGFVLVGGINRNVNEEDRTLRGLCAVRGINGDDAITARGHVEGGSDIRRVGGDDPVRCDQ